MDEQQSIFSVLPNSQFTLYEKNLLCFPPYFLLHVIITHIDTVKKIVDSTNIFVISKYKGYNSDMVISTNELDRIYKSKLICRNGIKVMYSVILSSKTIYSYFCHIFKGINKKKIW